MEAQPAAHSLEALRRQILGEALEDVISQGGGDNVDDCSANDLATLRQTSQVAAALQQLQLRIPRSSKHIASTIANGGDSESTGTDAAAAALSSTRFAGSPSNPLGVSPADLLAEALPSEVQRQAVLTAALPAIEAELQRRCRLVAAASGYGTDDFTGLADHICQLQSTACASQASQAEAWRLALEQAQQAVGALGIAFQLLVHILHTHKFQGQKAADEAHASFLHSQCAWLKEKLRLVELQLQETTYTTATVAVLHKVAEEVESMMGQAAERLRQATLLLEQYRSLGPDFEALAKQHRSVVAAVDEARYELDELEQYRQLAAVTGR